MLVIYKNSLFPTIEVALCTVNVETDETAAEAPGGLPFTQQ